MNDISDDPPCHGVYI